MSSHIVPLRVYFTIIATLMALTVLTVAVAFFDFKFMNTVIAITIAVIKAFLVVAFFMHLKYSARILWLFAGAGAVWFVIMIALLMSDYHSRPWTPDPQPWRETTAIQHPPAESHAAPAPAADAHH